MDALSHEEDRMVGLDLNLLVSLNALLRERSVSRAAAALGVSQPSISVALRRLRTHFGDELISRTGNAYSLTPVAVGLKDATATALTAVQAALVRRAAFDPAASQREFVLRGSDYAIAVLGARIVSRAEKEAPGVSFRYRDVLGTGFDDELQTLDQCDGVFLPKGALPGLPGLDVITDHWVCLLATANSLVGSEITREHLNEVSFVATLRTRHSPPPAFAQLSMLGLEPRISCVVDSMLALPLFLEGTDRIALIPSSLATILTEGRGLRTVPLPHDQVGLTATFYWHPQFTQDPAHQWMRGLLVDAGHQVSDDRSRPVALRQDAVPEPGTRVSAPTGF